MTSWRVCKGTPAAQKDLLRAESHQCTPVRIFGPESLDQLALPVRYPWIRTDTGCLPRHKTMRTIYLMLNNISHMYSGSLSNLNSPPLRVFISDTGGCLATNLQDYLLDNYYGRHALTFTGGPCSARASRRLLFREQRDNIPRTM